MKTPRAIKIEGFTPEEILALPSEQMDALVLTREPVVFQAGSASVLGEFKCSAHLLTVELAHIDGGNEGVLPTLWALAERYANKRGLPKMEWIVHAVNCAQPNLKLRRVLERRGFEVRTIGGAQVYYLVHEVRTLDAK